jgi:UPF0755 protein
MIPAPALPHYTPDGIRTSPLRRLWRRFLYALSGGLLLMLLGGLFYVTNNRPTENFPVGTEVVIEIGLTTAEITTKLYDQGVIRSPLLFQLVLTFLHDPRDVKASTYIFAEPLTTRAVAERLMLGDYGNDLVRFIHYEGEPRREIARRASQVLRDFNPDEFMTASAGLEGKLFPDTYLLPKNFTARELIELLSSTYENRVGPLRPAIADSGLTEDEVITLASILEREANTPQSKGLVAGIFLRRLEIGMPLQADASIEYVLDKPLSELTAADLDKPSPYNTYLNTGLPPTPIGNPGLTAIQAVLEPTPSPYLFYLTGNDGEFYYATTYEEHQRNINRYLR